MAGDLIDEKAVFLLWAPTAIMNDQRAAGRACDIGHHCNVGAGVAVLRAPISDDIAGFKIFR
jgi:hypothetical protein